MFDVEFGNIDEDAEHEQRSSPIDVEMWRSIRDSEVDAPEVTAELLRRGADPNHHAGITGHMPLLHLAAGLGKVESMKLLLDAGAVIEAIDREGWTALHMAAHSAEHEAVLLLAERGADPNAQIKVIEGSFNGDTGTEDFEVEYGQTAMHWTTYHEDPEEGAKMVSSQALPRRCRTNVFISRQYHQRVNDLHIASC